MFLLCHSDHELAHKAASDMEIVFDKSVFLMYVFVLDKYALSLTPSRFTVQIDFHIYKQEGHEALNRSPEYIGQSQTFNFEI